MRCMSRMRLLSGSILRGNSRWLNDIEELVIGRHNLNTMRYADDTVLISYKETKVKIDPAAVIEEKTEKVQQIFNKKETYVSFHWIY